MEVAMDPVLSALAETLVAGARAVASEKASQALRDAYQDLKVILVDGYGLVSAQLLEEGPSDEAKQEALREELKGHPAIADDETVLEKASAVRDALSREPSEALVVLGVDISNVDQDGSSSERQRSDDLLAQSSHDAQVRLDKMQHEIARLNAEQQAALERVKQLESTLATTKNAAREASEQHVVRTAEFESAQASLQNQVKQVNRKLSLAYRKHEELSNQLERVEIGKAKALRRCREVRHELKERTKEADAAKRKASLLTKKCEQLATENAELGQRLKALQTASAAQLILQPLVRNWLVKQRGKRNLRLPREVVLIGSGPLSEKEMRAILSAREIQAAPPEDPSTAVMIVGRDDWLVDDLEAQIRARGEVGLRVYSQEMLLAAFSTGDDPLEATRNILMQFADGHPALECLIESGFEWPKWVTSGSLDKFKPGKFADQSPLNALGYVVGKGSELPVSKRRNLLTKAFRDKLPSVESSSSQYMLSQYMKSWGEPGSRIRLRRAAEHIAWLVGFFGPRITHDVAVRHWRDDLNWMHKQLYEPWMRFRWPEIGYRKR
jgi:hypothetical protein